MTIDELLATYEEYLNFANYSKETKQRYLRIAEDFLDASRGVMTREAVMKFMQQHEAKSGTYRRWTMYVIKSLFTQARIVWPFNKREMPKLSKPKQPYFEFAAFEKFLEGAKTSLLDYALLRVDAVTGARRVELSSLLESDYVRPTLKIRSAKGSEDRVRTLDAATCSALERYIRSRKSRDGFLFVSERGMQLTPLLLTKRFRVLAKSAGLAKGYGYHAIRRGLATWLYREGWRTKEIGELVGWKDETMPGHYVQLVAGEVEQKAKETHPMFTKR